MYLSTIVVPAYVVSFLDLDVHSDNDRVWGLKGRVDQDTSCTPTSSEKTDSRLMSELRVVGNLKQKN